MCIRDRSPLGAASQRPPCCWQECSDKASWGAAARRSKVLCESGFAHSTARREAAPKRLRRASVEG
eukprot:10763489-Alexandrium_andersonii.AAC.1